MLFHLPVPVHVVPVVHAESIVVGVAVLAVVRGADVVCIACQNINAK